MFHQWGQECSHQPMAVYRRGRHEMFKPVGNFLYHNSVWTAYALFDSAWADQRSYLVLLFQWNLLKPCAHGCSIRWEHHRGSLLLWKVQGLCLPPKQSNTCKCGLKTEGQCQEIRVCLRLLVISHSEVCYSTMGKNDWWSLRCISTKRCWMSEIFSHGKNTCFFFFPNPQIFAVSFFH